jgi:hypothetical protein
VKVLANELLGTRLARRLGLPTPVVAVVEVREDLIRYTDDLVMQLGRGQVTCQAGLSFGSRYPGDPALLVVYDLLPEEQLRAIENLADFAGMLVFDKWTCNTNGRQTIFFRPERQTRYQAMMIDQGFCFNASEWNFPDAPLRGLYSRQLVYEPVRGLQAFEPWLSRLERIDEAALEKAAEETPPSGTISITIPSGGCSNSSSAGRNSFASFCSRRGNHQDNPSPTGREPCLKKIAACFGTGSCAIRRTSSAMSG